MNATPHPHSPSLSLYFAIFFALMALTGITIWIAFFDLGPLNTVAAMVIAALKASLVALYFMHLRYSPRLTWIFAGGALAWLGLLVTATLSDFASR